VRFTDTLLGDISVVFWGALMFLGVRRILGVFIDVVARTTLVNSDRALRELCWRFLRWVGLEFPLLYSLLLYYGLVRNPTTNLLVDRLVCTRFYVELASALGTGDLFTLAVFNLAYYYGSITLSRSSGVREDPRLEWYGFGAT
jgi:hypothetical protein